jgi:hypothetical protein
MNGLARALLSLALVIGILASACGSASAVATPIRFRDGNWEGPAMMLGFTAPEYAHYVATGYTDEGSATLSFDGHTQTFGRSSAILDLGLLSAGPHELGLDSPDGGAVGYSVTVTEQPPEVSGLTATPAYVGPGGSTTFHFGLSGPGFVQPFERLNWGAFQDLAGINLDSGQHDLVWNFRDVGGARVPDGQYQVGLTASNAVPGAKTWAGTVIYDTTPPTIKLSVDPPSAVNIRSEIGVDVRDPGPHPASIPNPEYGVAMVTASTDGGPPQDMGMTGAYPIEWNRYTVRGGVWTPGPHTVVFQATDFVGNTSRATVSLTVPARARGARQRPDCSTLAIKTAVRGSTSLNSALRHLAHKPHGDLFRTFLIDHRLCGDVTGDYVKELVVLLKEQHGSKTALAVFGQNGANWSLAYRDTRHSISNIKLTLFGLYEDTYVHGGILKHWRLHWDGHRFTRAAVK